MKDLQFIVLSDSLAVISTRVLEGRTPRTIEVVSSGNLNNTKKVTVNDVTVTDFTLIDQKTLYLRLSSRFDSLSLSEINIRVFSSMLTEPGKAFVEFDLTNRFTSVEGTQKLAQQVLKTLITTARTNRFNELEGGSLLQVLGGTLNPTQTAKVASLVARAVSSTKDFYLSVQTAGSLPFNERLLDLTVSSVEFDSSTLEVKALIKLTTFSGESEIIPIVL